MKRMMFLLIVLCLQYLGHPGVVFANMYPRIIVPKNVEVDNEDVESDTGPAFNDTVPKLFISGIRWQL